jgi:TIR domain
MPSDDFYLFVSYVKEDRSAAFELVKELERRGARCWIAPRNIKPGSRFDDEIADAIESCRAMLLVFSHHCNERNQFILRELQLADLHGKTIIPFRIENVEPKRALLVRLANLHRIDAFIERERAVEEVVRSLKDPSSPPPPPPQIPPTYTPPKTVQKPKPARQFPKEARPWVIGGSAVIAVLILAIALSQISTKKESPYVPPPPPPPKPDVSLAEMTARMADENRVTDAILRASDVLASGDKKPYFEDEDCQRDPRFRDLHKGMLLSQLGYRMVISYLRTDNMENYGSFFPDDHDQFDKSKLFSFWTLPHVTSIWKSSNALNIFSSDDKRAIAAFLTETKAFRPIYTIIKSGNPIFEPSLDIEKVKILLRAANRPVHKCQLQQVGFQLMSNISVYASGTPLRYMTTFWYRRDREGRMDLADQFLALMIGLLK